MVVFLDSNVLISFFIKEELHHQASKKFLSSSEKIRFITSSDVVSETLNWLTKKHKPQITYFAGQRIVQEKITKIIDTDTNDRLLALELIKKFSDYKLSYVDATSFALIHRLKIKQVYSYDADFNLLKGIENLAFCG